MRAKPLSRDSTCTFAFIGSMSSAGRLTSGAGRSGVASAVTRWSGAKVIILPGDGVDIADIAVQRGLTPGPAIWPTHTP